MDAFHRDPLRLALLRVAGLPEELDVPVEDAFLELVNLVGEPPGVGTAGK